jgi:hypothetical protein
VGSDDFDEYMIFHLNKILKDQYKPMNIAYPIRVPDHCPEGIIQIDRSKRSHLNKTTLHSLVHKEV